MFRSTSKEGFEPPRFHESTVDCFSPNNWWESNPLIAELYQTELHAQYHIDIHNT